jgi:hypothetical protein
VKLGHDVALVTNVFKLTNNNGIKDKKPFPLFYVDIKQKENNKEVFNIRYLLHCRVTIEPPKKYRGIPQCTNCQQLGHTKSFCNRQATCVKCAGDHHSKQCTKHLQSDPTCALCKEKGHTANYKGCPVYQKKLKAQQPKKITVVQRLQNKSAKQQTAIIPTTSGLSYAQVIKTSDDIQKQDKKQNKANNEPTIGDVMKMLSQLQTDIMQNLGQLANRVEKLENKSKPLKKQVKTYNK